MNKLEKLHEKVKKLEEHYENCRDKATVTCAGRYFWSW